MKRSSTKKTIYSNVYSRYKPPNTAAQYPGIDPGYVINVLLYQYIFTSRVTLVAALLLCVSLLVQPVAHVYAQEAVEDSAVDVSYVELPPIVDDLVDDQVSDEIEEVLADDPDELLTEEVTQFDLEQNTESQLLHENNDSGSTTQVVDLDDLPDTLLNATDTTPIESEDPDPAITSTSSDLSTVPVGTDAAHSTSATTTIFNENGTSTENTNDPTNDDAGVVGGDSNVMTGAGSVETTDSDRSDTATTTATTTQTVLEPTVQEVSVVNSDQSIAFNRNECTEVADGSFYCQKVTLNDLPEDALFAAPDSSGDMEIYVVKDGVQRQITNNTMEDASPHYDSRSETIVWHRLINDRYQIISYDIDSGEETQLTDTPVNNMEPTRSGSYTVWQRWVTNNWEIILFDGENEVQLTDSQQHDIAPHIHGDMVIWNVRSNDGRQSLMTYDIGTQTYNQIADTEGVRVVNPRMLVMYEAQYQNGDSVMKGFDLVTGEIIPIERLPRELPQELPSPDATGEIRALPTTLNDEDEHEQENPEPDKDNPLESDIRVGTTTVSTTTVQVSADLDLRPATTSPATTTDHMVAQAAIPDVIVPSYTAGTSTASTTSTQ